MRIETQDGVIELGETEVNPTIGITDFSRRVTDDFGVTTVVQRGFARRMSVRLALPFDEVDAAQRTLADLRATSALWVADDRFQWLAVNGFYKDFEVDLAVPPTSYCTLTVEGLAETETVVDAGGDPAPGGPSSLRLLRPATMTDAVLVSSNVAEASYPEWSAGASYVTGVRVSKAATHRVYECLASNVGVDPVSDPTKWMDVGPTNRWAMFDQALGTATSANGSITVSLNAGIVDAIAVLDVTAATVRVQATGYDRTSPVGAGAVSFLDLAGKTGTIIVTVTGSGTVSVGTLLIGRLVALGLTEAAPTAGITDFSRKVVDDFGEVTITERGWAKRMATRALIRTDAIDLVANRIASVRGTPALWIGEAGLDSLTIYGFFKEFSIEVGETVSKLSISIEGLAVAPKVQSFAGPPGESVVAQGSVDGVTWHDGLQPGDVYMRISNDSGVTFGAAVLIRGESGINGSDGADGEFTDYRFRRSSYPAATPTGASPAYWTDMPPIVAIISGGSARNNVIGSPMGCQPGETYNFSVFLNTLGTTHNCRFGCVFYNSFEDVTGGVFVYTPAVIAGGSPGFASGSITVPAGKSMFHMFVLQDASAGLGTVGWDITLHNPPALQMTLARKDAAGELLGPWSTPTQISGDDGAPGAGSFTLTTSAKATWDGRNLRAVGSTGWGDTGAYSDQKFVGGAIVSYFGSDITGPDATDFFVGLSSDTASSHHYNDIDYAWQHYYGHRNGDEAQPIGYWCRAWVNGVHQLLNQAGNATDDTWDGAVANQVHYDGVKVRWLRGGNVLHEVAAPANLILGADIAFRTKGYIGSLIFAPAGARGVPGLNGNDGTSAWTPVLVGVTRQGSTFTKPSGVYGWDSIFYSAEFFEEASVSCRPAQNNRDVMIGLTADPTASTSYTTIDYAVHMAASGEMAVYSNGTAVAFIGSYAVADTISVHKVGTSIQVRRNGVVLQATPGIPLALKLAAVGAFAHVGATLNNVSFTSRGFDGINGIDGIDGADGKLVEFVWTRSPVKPLTPTGNGIPVGWSDEPEPGDDPLWMSKSKQELTGVLVLGATWSEPIRHDGRPGENGVSPIAITASPSQVVIDRDSAGTPKAGELPAVIANVARQGVGTVPITAVAVVATEGCSADEDGTGIVITAITAPQGSVTYQVAAAGQTSAMTVPFVTHDDPPPPAAASLSITSTALANPSTLTQHGGTVLLNASPSGKLKASFQCRYKSDGLQVRGQLQYRPAGGAWASIGSAATGSASTDASGGEPGVPSLIVAGSLTLGAYTLTGLVATDQQYEFRLIAHKLPSGQPVSSFSGTIRLEHVE